MGEIRGDQAVAVEPGVQDAGCRVASQGEVLINRLGTTPHEDAAVWLNCDRSGSQIESAEVGRQLAIA
jgi:hypothetical protein